VRPHARVGGSALCRGCCCCWWRSGVHAARLHAARVRERVCAHVCFRMGRGGAGGGGRGAGGGGRGAGGGGLDYTDDSREWIWESSLSNTDPLESGQEELTFEPSKERARASHGSGSKLVKKRDTGRTRSFLIHRELLPDRVGFRRSPQVVRGECTHQGHRSDGGQQCLQRMAMA
jgi:hypothetical protein